MSGLTFNLAGEGGIHLQYSGTLLNTAQTLPAAILVPPDQFYFPFTSGASTFRVGQSLTGATSSMTGRVVAIVVTSGTLGAGTATGICFIGQVSGTITAGENMQTAGPVTQCVAQSAQMSTPRTPAKSLFFTVETNTIRFCYNGDTPTNITATPASFGHPVTDGGNGRVDGWLSVKRFSFINADSTKTAVVDMTVQY